jgi:hypothetical protein
MFAYAGSSRPTRDWPDFTGDRDRTYLFLDGQSMALDSQPPQPQNGWWDNSWNSWLQPAKDSKYSGMRKGQAYCGSIKANVRVVPAQASAVVYMYEAMLVALSHAEVTGKTVMIE